MRKLLCLAVFFAFTASAGLICTIGPDDFGSAVRVYTIDPVAGVIGSPFDLPGDAIYSGLTYDSSSSRFYAVMMNGDGSSLVSFDSAGGSFSSVMQLTDSSSGMAFNGGLVYAGGSQFYAMANTSEAVSMLYRITVPDGADPGSQTLLTGSFDQGFTGGLAFDGGVLYGLRNDSGWNSYVYSFALAGDSATASPVWPASFGGLFGGGLVWSGGRLYALSGDGSLATIDSTGSIDSFLVVPAGFFNAGMTLGPDGAPPPSPVPEPAAWALLSAGFGFALVRRLRRS